MTKLDDMLFNIKMNEFAAGYTGSDDEKGCEACVTCGAPTDWAQQLAYHEAQDGLLSRAQDEVAQCGRPELAEAQRPLDVQMARLNENLTAANARLMSLELDLAHAHEAAGANVRDAERRIAELKADSERLDWMQFHGARVAWGNDDEACNVVWSDSDASYYTALFSDWRDAIDAAMDNHFKESV